MLSLATILGLGMFGAPGAAAQTVPDNTWAPAGPAFSTVLTLERSPGDPSVLLAGTYFGGLYRSTDYGFSWQHVDAEFSSQSIFTIAFASATTIYVGIFHNGVYRSVDAGQTWAPLSDGLSDLDVQAVAVDPFDSSVVLAATSAGGVFRSATGGGGWQRVDQQTPALQGKSIAFDPLTQGVVYLGTIGLGAYRSTDDGLTFQRFNDGLLSASVLSLRFGAPPSRELYAAADNGAFKLRRDAATWTEITGNLPPYPLSDLLPHPVIEHFAFAATLVGAFVLPNDEADPNWIGWTTLPTRVLSTDPTGSVFHAASIHGALQATTDFGRSWYQANTGIQNLFIGALSVVDGGASGPLVYAGSDFAVHRRTSGIWDTFFDQKQGVFDIEADPATPGTLYLGSERTGVWKSTDGGAGWVPSSTNLVPANVYSLGQSADGITVFAATSSGVYLSPNNGEFWVAGNASQLGIALSVAPDPTRAPFLFVGGADGRVVFSQDGGFSYRDASHGLPSENVTTLVTAPWEKTYAITGSGNLFATSDQGLNWFAAKAGVGEPAVSIAADPTRPWILYLGTAGGGVYKSESGSLDWTPRNVGLTSPFVFSTAVDRTSPSLVYAGTLDGVFASNDGALTWTRRSAGLPPGRVTALVVDPTASGVLYASVQDAGVYRSVDGGASWLTASASLPVTGAMPIVINQLQPSQLFVGTTLGGVYRSSDSGASWQQSSFGMTLFVRGIAIDPANTSTLYAGSLGAGVFKSTDASTTWTSVGLRDRNVFKLAIDPRHTGTLYAATSAGLSRTTDAGATWRTLAQPAAFVNAMAVDSRDRRRVFIGSTGGSVYRSIDAGETWDLTATGLPPVTIYALAIDGANGALYAAADHSGVWTSSNDGASWTALPGGPLDHTSVSSLTVARDHKVFAATVGMGVFVYAGGSWTNASAGLASPQVADVQILGNGVILAATFDAGLFRSTDGGLTWLWASSGLTTSRVTSITADPAVAARAYVATPDGVFSTTDGGQTWNASNGGMRGVNTWAVAVDSTAPAHLWASTNGFGVFSSSDAGLTWTASTAGMTDLDVRHVAAGAVPGSVYAATLGGGLSRSSDGGATWSGGVTPDLINSFILAVAVNPSTPSIVYAAAAGRGVLKSTNGGIDWAPASNGLGSPFLLSLAIDPQHPDTLYAGTADSGVFYTTDGGNSWHALNTGLFNQVVTSLAINPSDTTQIFAGTEGGGVFANHVSLPASACTFTTSQPLISIASPASHVSVQLTTTDGCAWSVESGSEWLTIPGAASRTGSATVIISAAINTDQDARSGRVTIAGRPIVIVQAGLAKLFRLSVTRTGTGSGTVTSDWIGIACGTDCAQMYTDRLPVVLTATAAQGSVFAGWSGDPDCAAGVITMAGDRACVARFDYTGDFDGDGLSDSWETKFGLNPAVATGDDGPDGDPDHDGRTNAQELRDGTHPRGFVTRYFARGVADDNHRTQVALFNPLTDDARVLVRLIPDSGPPVAEYRYIAALSRATVDTTALSQPVSGSFAVIVESDRTVVADRTIVQQFPYAADAERGAETLSTAWYLAEGTTRGGRDVKYSLFNPGSADATVDVAYLPTGAAAAFARHTVAAGKRVLVDLAADATLTEVDVATVMASDAPIVVEASIAGASGETALGASASPSPAFLGFLADGRTGSLLATRVDLLNPTDDDADVVVTYVLGAGGIVQVPHQVGAYSRLSLDPASDDPLLAAADFGVVAASTRPVVMTGTTWWPGTTPDTWYAGESTPAIASAGTRWALASGETGGSQNSQTEIAVANVSANAGAVRIHLVFDDGSSVERELPLPAVTHLVVDVGQLFPEALWKSFSALIESIAVGGSPAPDIVVERSTYTSPGDLPRAGGTRVGATAVPE